MDKNENDKVKVQLVYDEEHKEPVFVGVNGKGYLVERGRPVEVPQAVAEVLRNAEEQRMNSVRYMDEHAKQA